MNSCIERLYNGIIKENPTFVLALGMCSTLAITTSAINGIGMGLATTVVLALSNMMISMLRKLIPDSVRVPAYIVIVATFVTVVQFLLEGFVPSLYNALGIYIPLIVVNCIILGRAESYASKNPVMPSLFDGIGMGLGFTLGITLVGAVREIIGSGSIFGVQIIPLADEAAGKAGYEPITIFVLAPGAFFVLAALVTIINAYNRRDRKSSRSMYCNEGACLACTNWACPQNQNTDKPAYVIQKERMLKEAAEKKTAKKAETAQKQKTEGGENS